LMEVVVKNFDLQIERERILAAWSEIRRLGRSIAMPHDFGEAGFNSR